jgi:dienelactone hydrolase
MSFDRRLFLKRGVAAGAGLFGSLLPQRFAGGEEPSGNVGLVHTDIAAAIEKAELSLLFRGTTTQACQQWQQGFRSQLADLLGDFEPPEKWELLEEDRHEAADHIRHDLVLQAEGIPPVPVYLLVPLQASPTDDLPAVLCVHGHGRYGHHPVVGRNDIEGVAADIERMNYDYGLQFVRRGFVVAAPCMIPFGRRVDRESYGGKDPCAVTFVRMQALGELPMAANLRDLRWCLDLLQSRPEVDGGRIGCAGLSYGGRMTMLVSAMDERIRVAAVSGALNLLQERMTLRHSCGSQIIPGLLKFGDYSEIGSLIAPRPSVWEVGSADSLLKPSWAALFRRRLERAYSALDARDQLEFDYFEGGHRWNGKMAFPLFDKVLSG